MSIEKPTLSFASESYKGKAEYWDKHEPRVMGDLRNRAPLLEMMGEIRGHSVLEAGSGTGYFARMLAEKGALVTGVELTPDMIEKSRQAEEMTPQDIAYVQGDITHLPVDHESFDYITCVGVLIHLDEAQIRNFLGEARRVLKKDGALYIGVNHPDLYRPESPHRRPFGFKADLPEWQNDVPSWVKYTPTEKDRLYQDSQLFREDYYDKDGKLFTSSVWHHTKDTYKRLIKESGLKLETTQDQIVQKEDLLAPSWGTEYGDKAYLHLKVTKES